MKNVALEPTSDGGVALVSQKTDIKLCKLTTYVLAAVEPPAVVQIHTVSFRAAHPGSTVGLRLDSILIIKARTLFDASRWSN